MMDDSKALEIVNKIFNGVFGKDNKLTLDQLLDKFAFDVKLPKQVVDSTTNEITWADSINSGRYIKFSNMEKKEKETGWMLEKRSISNLQDLIDIWNSVNLTATERVNDSIDVAKSDTIYRCEKIYRCSDTSDSKNMIFCDSCANCEYVLASQRSSMSNFCIRVDDSTSCSNSYNVICSAKISNSFFIQDANSLHECMFCSHIANRRYCIANMQFDREEYMAIKSEIIKWIVSQFETNFT